MAWRANGTAITPGSGTSAAPAFPAGTAQDDILVAFIYLESAATITAPSGWTLLRDLSTSATTRGRMVVYWKRHAGASENTSPSWSWTGSTWRGGVIGAWSGRVTTGDPWDDHDVLENSAQATSAPVATTTTQAGDDLVLASTSFAAMSTSWTAPANYTERTDTTVLTVDTRDDYQTVGSSGSVGPTANASDWIKTFHAALKAAPQTTVKIRAVTTGAPAAATAFTPTLPTHATGDRLTLVVTGKYNLTTVPTINQGWTLVKSGTGGTGVAGNDTGEVFWAVYQKDAASAAETAPTVTPGVVAPNSWEWVCFSASLPAGATWADTIAADGGWVQSASDTITSNPLTGTAGAWTNPPTAGDAIFEVAVIPTDLGSALGATTITATGLSGGTKSTATTQYIENALGADSAAVYTYWTDFTGTATAGLEISHTVTGASNHSGSIVAIALRQASGSSPRQGSASGSWSVAGSSTGTRTPKGSGTGTYSYAGSATGRAVRQGSASGSYSYTGAATGSRPLRGHATASWTASGAATGARGSSGQATGSWTIQGSSTGSTSRSGSATGSYSFTTTAQGQTQRGGASSAAYAFTATAEGQTQPVGAGSGSYSFAGAATGATSTSGSAAGSWQVDGTATGAKITRGSAAGSWHFTGEAAGPTIGNSGAASGLWTYSGSGVGATVRRGASTATWQVAGAASGRKLATGAATGAWVYAVTASGRAESRDLELVAVLVRDRLSARAVADRLAARTVKKRETTAVLVEDQLEASTLDHPVTALAKV
jgi:hypothetical protein